MLSVLLKFIAAILTACL